MHLFGDWATGAKPPALEKIVANGGKVLAPKTEIPNIGWYAFFSDPTGNNMALYKSISGDAS